ncbi:hypothetical protein ACU6U9_19630 [Pseudomonas sp. HK3]
MSEQVKSALMWLTHILDSQQVRYQIVGELAAYIHGSLRDVADIDLYISKSNVEKILPLVDTFISKPLAHYIEGSWDLEYFQLIYQSQKIEIGLSPGTKIFDSNGGQWIELEINFKESLLGEYYGMAVPVMPVCDLLRYK